MMSTCEYDEEVDTHQQDGPRHRTEPLECPVLHPEHEVPVVAAGALGVGRAPPHPEWQAVQWLQFRNIHGLTRTEN